MLPSPLEQTFSFGLACFMMVGVAALASEVIEAALSNPIPWKEKQRLIDAYGRWAVETAEGCCPHGDVACVEREARRLYQARTRRR
jgi:hypothetical protein